ncbi:hypothetical protein MKW98_022593 [Papaver atlanticum]|uniref:TAFII28-like protein domain-containing protein n=1 Tax=Papaver atlanticum TaxID=357466 RepID=A0AAD4SME7_9MAGN|nr:hypothetical protein MKW98_022593 [Papaver atlanticum]
MSSPSYQKHTQGRYKSFSRSWFQKATMKKLLASIIRTPKISVPMTIVVSGIAEMFVGELVETANRPNEDAVKFFLTSELTASSKTAIFWRETTCEPFVLKLGKILPPLK